MAKAKPKPKPKPGTLIPQAHGGALLAGVASPGRHVPGPGRPASELRQLARLGFEARLVELTRLGKEAASDSDRIRAIDILGKYGLGTIQEMSVDSVRGRLARTIELIRSELEPEQAATLLAKMAVLWE